MSDNISVHHPAISEGGLVHFSCPNIVSQTLEKKGKTEKKIKFFVYCLQSGKDVSPLTDCLLFYY